MGKLDGKVAAVTGGGRGIGRGVARTLAAQGAAVVVNDFGVSLDGQKETVSPAERWSRRSWRPAAKPSPTTWIRDRGRRRGPLKTAIDRSSATRHPGQHRRHPARPDDLQHVRAGVGRRHPGPPQGPLQHDSPASAHGASSAGRTAGHQLHLDSGAAAARASPTTPRPRRASSASPTVRDCAAATASP